MKKNNYKKFGLRKEREVKNKLESMSHILFAERSRGSFGAFDVTAYTKHKCLKISVKSTSNPTNDFEYRMNAEIKKLREIEVPSYCERQLWVYRSPKKDYPQKGWQIINIE